MTRLKYNQIGGTLCTEWFTLAPNLIVRGYIDTKTFEYQLREFDSGLMFEGQAKDLRSAKTKLKTLLTKSGVNFSGEIRKSR